VGRKAWDGVLCSLEVILNGLNTIMKTVVSQDDRLNSVAFWICTTPYRTILTGKHIVTVNCLGYSWLKLTEEQIKRIRAPYDQLGQRTFPLTSVSRPALGPTQPPVQWVPGVLSPGVKRGRGVMLTTHSHLLPRSRMSRSCTFSPKRLQGVQWDSFTLLWK
jgi:hypothetical protein